MKAKRVIIVLMFISVFLIGGFALSACGDSLPDNSDGIGINLIVLDINNTNHYEKKLFTTKSSLLDALGEFEGLQILATSNFLGAYINSVSIGTIEENEYGKFFSENLRLEGSITAGTYIAVYHNIDDVLLKDFTVADLTYDENTYYYSGVSVSSLPLYDGATYILKLGEF